MQNTSQFSIFKSDIRDKYYCKDKLYRLLVGKAGLRWFVADQLNEGDNVYVAYESDRSGFGGSVIQFTLLSGEIVKVVGPWHSNSDALFADTGYDCRDKHYTMGIIALDLVYDREHPYAPATYVNVLHEDTDMVLGSFDRILSLAQSYANSRNCTVYYAVVSMGGGRSGALSPKIR